MGHRKLQLLGVVEKPRVPLAAALSCLTMRQLWLAMLCIAPLTAQQITKDIVYREGASKAWRLDLILPDGTPSKPRPAIVFVHGGGWRGGDKSGFTQMALPYARNGYVAISVTYRLSQEAPFPAAVEDVKCAVRWLRANAAKYSVDPKRIGAHGNSAGAHLVTMLGLVKASDGLEGDGPYRNQSSAVQAVAAAATPTDFNKWADGYASYQEAVLPFAGNHKQKASPLTYVRKDAPPFLLIHGTGDKTVPFDQAERFVAAMKKAGARDVTLLRYEGEGHNVFRSKAPETVNAMADFFRRILKP